MLVSTFSRAVLGGVEGVIHNFYGVFPSCAAKKDGRLTALYTVTSLTSSVIYIYLHNINYVNKIKSVVGLIVLLLHLQILDCIKDKIGGYDSRWDVKFPLYTIMLDETLVFIFFSTFFMSLHNKRSEDLVSANGSMRDQLS